MVVTFDVFLHFAPIFMGFFVFFYVVAKYYKMDGTPRTKKKRKNVYFSNATFYLIKVIVIEFKKTNIFSNLRCKRDIHENKKYGQRLRHSLSLKVSLYSLRPKCRI